MNNQKKIELLECIVEQLNNALQNLNIYTEFEDDQEILDSFHRIEVATEKIDMKLLVLGVTG